MCPAYSSERTRQYIVVLNRYYLRLRVRLLVRMICDDLFYSNKIYLLTFQTYLKSSHAFLSSTTMDTDCPTDVLLSYPAHHGPLNPAGRCDGPFSIPGYLKGSNPPTRGESVNSLASWEKRCIKLLFIPP